MGKESIRQNEAANACVGATIVHCFGTSLYDVDEPVHILPVSRISMCI